MTGVQTCALPILDPETAERWKSYQYRKEMKVTVEEYDNTPALIIDWDMELMRVEQRVQDKKNA